MAREKEILGLIIMNNQSVTVIDEYVNQLKENNRTLKDVVTELFSRSTIVVESNNKNEQGGNADG